MSLRHLVFAFPLLSVFAIACSAEHAKSDDPSSTELVGAKEDDGVGGRDAETVVGTVVAGQSLKTTAGLNLRDKPSTSGKILLVIPKGSLVTLLDAKPTSGWYHVKFAGTSGWCYGLYLEAVPVSAPPPDPGTPAPPPSDAGTAPTDSGTTTPPATPPPPAGPADAMVTRAKAGVGFSYWWGHGRWSLDGVSSSTPAGSCSGSCPSCTHSGSYGADCSGYVAKIWQIPSSNTDLTIDKHPYATADFVSDGSLWSTVSRGALTKGDALVYNSGGAGHIFLYESGDGWGSMWAYEAKGCSYGIIHDLRTATSAYHGIRKK